VAPVAEKNTWWLVNAWGKRRSGHLTSPVSAVNGGRDRDPRRKCGGGGVGWENGKFWINGKDESSFMGSEGENKHIISRKKKRRGELLSGGKGVKGGESFQLLRGRGGGFLITFPGGGGKCGKGGMP